MRIDAHQHFWRYDPARVRLDRRLDGGAAPRLPAGRRSQREMARAGVDACVAVQARQTLEETRWLLELADAHPFIAGVVGWVDLQAADVERAARARSRATRSSSASATSSRASRTIGFCCGRRSAAASRCSKTYGLAYDILSIARHLPVAAELVGALPAAALRARSPGEAGHPRRRDSTTWERDLRRARGVSATSGASCRAWSPKRTGTAWTPAQLRPYLDVAFDCVRPGAADGRIGLAGLHASRRTTRGRWRVVRDYLRRSARERARRRARRQRAAILESADVETLR